MDDLAEQDVAEIPRGVRREVDGVRPRALGRHARLVAHGERDGDRLAGRCRVDGAVMRVDDEVGGGGRSIRTGSGAAVALLSSKPPSKTIPRGATTLEIGSVRTKT